MSPFISASDIPANTIFIDCRFALGSADPDAGYKAFKEEHISGARYANLDSDLAATPKANANGHFPDGRHPLPDPEQWQHSLSKWGISPTNTIVVYDDHNNAFAARAWWLLSQSGFSKVYVLDGGFSHWKKLGLATSRGSAPCYHNATNQVDYLKRRELQPWQLQQQASCLVDARAAERYRGDIEPLDPYAGHIPGAHNRPFGQNFDNGLIKPKEELREIWGELLDNQTRTHYCGSGVTACVNLLVLKHLGYDDEIFVPSWSGWCASLN